MSEDTNKTSAPAQAKPHTGGDAGGRSFRGGRGGGGGGRSNHRSNRREEKPEFDQETIDLARVTRVTKGGKQMSFRACVVIGDRKGRVGFGLDKGKDVQLALEKAVNKAKKTMIKVPITNETIPHAVFAKLDAGRVILKPAPKGSGLIAGSVVRIILELAGVPNASAKLIGKTKNRVTNVKVVFSALSKLRNVARGKKPAKVIQSVEAVPSGDEDKKSPRSARPRKPVATKAAE